MTVTAPDGSAASARGLSTWLRSAAPASARGDVTVALISDGRMRALNRAFRGKNHATDVLSFPVEAASDGHGRAPRPRQQGRSHSDPGDYRGDIVIATGVAARQAEEAGHSMATELRVLALHGLLHLLGYDHERDSGEMARAENRLRRKAGLKEGLLARRSR